MRLVCRAMISSREARSASSSSVGLPFARRFDSALDIDSLYALFGGQPRPAEAAGVAAEFRDHDIIDGDMDVVDPRASGSRDLAGPGHEAVAELAGLDKGDAALRGDHALVVRIAGKGECRIRQRENEPAMSDALAVDHMRL